MTKLVIYSCYNLKKIRWCNYMKFEYQCKKQKYALSTIRRARISFLNGDVIELWGKEIVDLQVVLYDNLIHFDNCYHPAVKSGFMKIKLGKNRPTYDSTSVYNFQDYLYDRKGYIKKCCLTEGGIFAISFFDALNWGKTIFGNITVKEEGDFLVLEFLSIPALTSSDSKNHTVRLKDVKEEDFRMIHLDFENCDGIDVYRHEIKEINLNFEKTLRWNSQGFSRVLKNGYIRLKFNKSYGNRRYSLWFLDADKIATTKHLERRICGNGEATIDICNLYVYNYHLGALDEKEEQISVPDLVKYHNDIAENDDDYDDYEDDISYVSGYAKKQNDGSILIVFGKSLQDSKL